VPFVHLQEGVRGRPRNLGLVDDPAKRLQTNRWLVVALGIALLAAIVAAVAYASVAAEKPPARPRERRRRPLVLGALAVTVVAGALVGGAYAYDASRDGVVGRGFRIGPVEVGGLTPPEATQRLLHAYRRLERPLVVESDVGPFWLDPGRANVVVHVDEAVSRALARTRRSSFLARTLRDVTAWPDAASITPRISFDRREVERFATRVEEAVERRPRGARVIPRAGGLVVANARPGLEVDRLALKRAIERALVNVAAPRRIGLRARRMWPKVTVADLARRVPAYITVDRSRFRLRLYERLKLTRSYPISVGQVGYETPSGLYRIQNKAVNPTWSVPYSPWTGSLAGAVIPPGPSNPLKARWLGIYGGAGIHGTDQTWSLGSAASHGCIRMAIPDVIDLYERVEVGTPVYIG
jgi:lipoprotein-anchoring transpeptidase ErfK/SrfK